MRSTAAADGEGMSSVESGRRTFHGDIVPDRIWMRGIPWDRVDVERDKIVLRPWLRPRRAIDRAAVDAVGFQQIKIPFMNGTDVRFLREEQDVVPVVFHPLKLERFREALEDLGWPVSDCKPVPPRGYWRGR